MAKDTLIKLNENQIKKVNNELIITINEEEVKLNQNDLNFMETILNCENNNEQPNYINLLNYNVDKDLYDSIKDKDNNDKKIRARLKMCGVMSGVKWKKISAINKHKETTDKLTLYNSNENTLLLVKIWKQ